MNYIKCADCFRFNLCGLTHEDWNSYEKATNIGPNCQLEGKTEEQVRAEDSAWEKHAKEEAEKEHNKRKAIYCSRCQMWFDTSKGWQAVSSQSGLPLCPACGAPLFEGDYDEFVKVNENRWEEVSTWEWPNGLFWLKKRRAQGEFLDIRA